MDFSWITGRIAVGGGIWNAKNMAEIARSGITHIIDMQLEFDDRPLAEPLGVRVLWNPVDDDFLPKSADVFQLGIGFARPALNEPESKLLIHCAAGVHRAPMMALALLCSLGWKLPEAMGLIESRRPVVDFPEVYVKSVKDFLAQQGDATVTSRAVRASLAPEVG
jgi:protein-tyrosine phosphatase